MEPNETSTGNGPVGTAADATSVGDVDLASTSTDSTEGGTDGDARPAGVTDKTETVRSASRGDATPQDIKPKDTGQAPAPKDEWKIEDLPAPAQKMISDLRNENGKSRVENKQLKATAKDATDKAKASDEKFASAIQAFMTGLGLTPEQPEEVTPERLAAQLTDATKAHEVTASDLKASRIELAVYRSAGKHGADADALLDSRGFIGKVAALDPSTEDFGDQVAAAIKDAVAANPKLKAAAASAAVAPSGGEFSGGPAARPTADSWSVDDFIANNRKARKRG